MGGGAVGGPGLSGFGFREVEGCQGSGRGGRGRAVRVRGEVEDIVVVVVGSRNPLKLHNNGDEEPPATNRTTTTKRKEQNKNLKNANI